MNNKYNVCFEERFIYFKMTEIVSGVLKLTFRFLANKARSKISERLNDGDVTNEECRRLIVGEIDDIKRKVDGLARKDLLSSLSFLQEGINGLYQLLQKFKESENGSESTEQATSAGATSSQETVSVSQINEVVSLVNAFNSLKIHSKERFKSAKKSFQLAREKATEAFSNEALSIEDRIQATQVRMMARIFENSEDPDAGVSDCLHYLEELHGIKAIQEMFSVAIDGGIKSRFNKTKRLNNASSVDEMNLRLFDFAREFTNLRTVFFNWPMILSGKKTLHPLVRSASLLIKYEKSSVNVTLLDQDFLFPDFVDETCCVVNSKREILARVEDDSIQILNPSGESRTIFDPSKQEDLPYSEVVAMDIDAEDNLYVITAFRESDDQPWNFELLIFDEHGDKKLESLLPFQHGSAHDVRVAVNNDKKIAVVEPGKQILHVGTSCKTDSFIVDNSFHLKELFDRVRAIRFLDNNGTKIIVAYWHCFYIYTENGELERKVMMPEEYEGLDSVAINYVTKQILVKTGWENIHLCSFSDTGELKDNVCLESKVEYTELGNAKIISNPHGAVALVKLWRVLFLQFS
ncbi:uncharacterized protein LOC114529004 [Dendronephthya gigantea]|uniref:uncharacterized protein LOC114529004 n=1 Tax=Dendronephthya gigantea TaxID=151771 RepID=UPI00106C44B2|nr:uncharacterized protein LOC114529004 [Dendronephthya gigantea]